MWYERIIAAHRKVTDNVTHGEAMKSDRYFVWMEDGANDFEASGRHSERAVSGSTDFFTKKEFDPWAGELEKAFDEDGFIAWRLNTIQFEPDTGFYHYEWLWEVIDEAS